MSESLFNPTFSRRLLTALWIHELPRANLPALMEASGWPRRTLQDIIKALPSWGIEVVFEQEGVRHNDGYYLIRAWGPFDPNWIARHRGQLREALE